MKDKQYQPVEFSIEKYNSDIYKNAQDFYITFSCENLKIFQHPRFFIRKSDHKGVLRLNFCTYFPVEIPPKFQAGLDKKNHLEMIVSLTDGSENTNIYIPISHVLKFPELYELHSQKENSDPDSGNQNDSPQNQTESPHTQNAEKTSGGPEDLSCRRTLKIWMSAHDGFSIQARKHKNNNFCLITDNQSKLFLVCLFEQSGEWLADEDIYPEGHPLYFSDTANTVSPVFSAATVADYLWFRTGLHVPALVLLADSVSIFNEQEHVRERMLLPTLCGCNRENKYGVIQNFDEYTDELLKNEHVCFTPEQIAALSDGFMHLNEASLQEYRDAVIRIFELKQMMPYEYTAADIIKIWLKGNYCKSILLAKYLDEDSGGTFDLIYNFSNIALFFEKTPATADPVAAVKAIREKLSASGITAALTACVVTAGEGSEYDSADVKCYDYYSLFSCDEHEFTRDMEFDQYPEMSQSEVRKLVDFADKTFSRHDDAIEEKYDPEYAEKMLDILNRLEVFFDDKKVFLQYETNLFAHTAWTVVQQTDTHKTVIVLKSFYGKNIEKAMEKIENEHEENCEESSMQTRMKTVILVPERISKTLGKNNIGSNEIFFTGIDDFSKLLCKILIND